MKIEILGVKIDKISKEEIFERIDSWILGSGQRQIVTVNPEFVMAARKNKDFCDTLNRANIATCDGVGLVYAGKLLAGQKLTRVTGVDLVKNLLEAENKDYKIYLLGGKEGIAMKLADKYLTKKFFKDEKIVGAESGGRLDTKNWKLEDNDQTIKRIKESGANILLVAFGQVKQEMWVRHNLDKTPNIKVAIGVGGTFDYLSGQTKRAPKSIRDLGLEWMYRLFTQPKRLGRIFNATVRFVCLVLSRKIRGN